VARATAQRLAIALPGLLFLFLAGLGLWSGTLDAEPSWLRQALEHGSSLRERGGMPLRGLDPVTDPRVLAGALLAWMGLPAAWILGLGRATGLLTALAAVLLIARRPGEHLAAGAWFLAASPLWITSGIQGDPLVFVGTALVMLRDRTGPPYVRAAILGWILGWSIWGWVALLLVPLGSLLRPGQRGRGVAVVLLSGVALWILNPLALIQPGAWLASMLREAELQKLWSATAHVGTQSSLTPLVRTVHVAGLALLAAGVAGWPRRIRGGDLSPVAALLTVFLAARSGFALAAPLTVLLPWAAGEISRGWEMLAKRMPRPSGHWRGRLLLALLLVPLLLRAGTGVWEQAATASAGPEAIRWMEANLEPGTLVIHDVEFTPPDSTRLVYLAIPFHAIDPNIYRETYWMGWYQAAGAALISERLLVRYLREPERSGSALEFYEHLIGEATGDRTFGGEPGRRARLLTLPNRGREALGEGWRDRVAEGREAGLPGEFLASLGGALQCAGHTGTAASLLQEALAAGFGQLGVYLNLAGAYSELDRPMEAGRILDEGRRFHPDSEELLYRLSIALTEAEMWSRAVRTLGRLRKLWPRSARVCYLLGVSLAHEGRPRAARDELERALDLDPALPERASILEYLETLPE